MAHHNAMKPGHNNEDKVAPSDVAETKHLSHSDHLSFPDEKASTTNKDAVFIEESPDSEKGNLASSSHYEGTVQTGWKGRLSRYSSHWKIFFQIFIWLLFTGYVVPMLARLMSSPLTESPYLADGGSQA